MGYGYGGFFVSRWFFEMDLSFLSIYFSLHYVEIGRQNGHVLRRFINKSLYPIFILSKKSTSVPLFLDVFFFVYVY